MKTNSLKWIKNVVIGIFKLPIYILFGIRVLLRNLTKNLKFSIRRKIAFNYLTLYIVSCIISLCILIGGVIFYKLHALNTRAREDIVLIQNELEQNNDVVDVLVEIARERDANIFITSNQEGILYSNTSTKYYKVYPETFFEYIRFVRDYGYYPHRYYIFNDDVYYNVYFYYKLSKMSEQSLVMGVLLLVGQALGYVIIWSVGYFKTKKVLKPIHQMTKTAKRISISNMDARINVKEAKYELKDLALTLNAMLDRLSDDYIKQKRFVSDVSHELRTPISIVHGYARMLQRWGSKDPEILEESIMAIKNESENMKELVEDLLFLARHDNQTLKYNKEAFLLDELLEEVIKETGMIDNKHVLGKLIETNLMIHGDKNRIKQAIRIFVDNAIKYTPPSGKITISARKDVNHIRISIKDTGIGIDRKDLEHIFDRFYRSDKSRTRETGGHGLGLSIAKIIILGHKGTIRVRSKVNAGTEFIINLPSIEKK